MIKNLYKMFLSSRKKIFNNNNNNPSHLKALSRLFLSKSFCCFVSVYSSKITFLYLSIQSSVEINSSGELLDTVSSETGGGDILWTGATRCSSFRSGTRSCRDTCG